MVVAIKQQKKQTHPQQQSQQLGRSLSLSLCVCVCVYLCSAHGQIAGDPAPGRSPGPPPDGSDFVGATAPSQRPPPAQTQPEQDNETIEGGAGAPDDRYLGAATPPATNGDCARAAAAQYLRPLRMAAEPVKTQLVAAGAGQPVRLEVVHDVFDTGAGLVNHMVYTARLLFSPSAAAIRDFYVEVLNAGRFLDIREFGDPDNVAIAGNGQRLDGGQQQRDAQRCARCACANVWTERLLLAEWSGGSGGQYSGGGGAGGGSRRRASGAIGTQRSIKWFVNMPNLYNKTVKFRIMFRKVNSSAVFETVYTHHLLEDCNLTLLHPSASLDYTHMPLYDNYENCTVFFPSRRQHDFQHNHILNSPSTSTTHHHQHNNAAAAAAAATSSHSSPAAAATQSSPLPTKDPVAAEDGESPTAGGGLIVQLTRLNVPCAPDSRTGSRAFLELGVSDNSSHSSSSSSSPSPSAARSLCGKLEDLPLAERTQFFPLGHRTRLRLVRHPSFRLRYDLVDTCFNVSFRARNGSYFVRPRDTMNCTFAVHLPYGNRIRLRLVENGRDEEDDQEAGGSAERIVEEVLDMSSGAHFRSSSGIRHLATSGNANNGESILADADADGLEDAGGGADCADGVRVLIFDPHSTFQWTDCVRSGSRERHLTMVSNGNRLLLRIRQRRPPPPPDAAAAAAAPSVFFAYEAVPDVRIVSQCPFGWIAVPQQQMCLTAVERPRTWMLAEMECKALGGHLAVIRNEREQRQIDVMLLAGVAGQRKAAAYWVGASDRAVEGEFRWTSGYPFGFSNWFPGWPEFNNYNKQPNDDSLSGQDCVEIRRYFQPPGGGTTSSASASASAAGASISSPSLQFSRDTAHTFMWNDRDCNATNSFLCERAMADTDQAASDPDGLATIANDASASGQLSQQQLQLQQLGDRQLYGPTSGRSLADTCNRTVQLSRERQRAHIWSPSYPFEYPDNTNCFTVVQAPAGYSVVLEFEEFVLESEPECSYDYLEIIDPLGKWQQAVVTAAIADHGGAAKLSPDFDGSIPVASAEENFPVPAPAQHTLRSLYMKYMTHQQRMQQQQQQKRSLPSTENTANSKPNSNSARVSSFGGVDSDNVTVYAQFMRTYAALRRSVVGASVVLRIPAPATVNSAAEFQAAKSRPHRVCGDWNAKLKLLRYTSAGPLLGLRFSSDYSHHRSGFKARVMLKNASSECSDDRHIPFAGSCYLFVSYPEVDWPTAQSVCRGIGANLASVRTVDEQRFIVDQIRHQTDYTTHTIYWLGGEQLPPAASVASAPAASAFRWSDGRNMSYVGWLPGDEIIVGAGNRRGQRSQGANRSAPPLCIALRWKLSPTPMLPSSIYWSAERCSKYGGYVCKTHPTATAVGGVVAVATSANNNNNNGADGNDGAFTTAGDAKSDEPAGSGVTPVISVGAERWILENRTIEGREGRLTSPGYPNTYPPNTDFWIRIRGPPNTRLLVQFQSIDLEQQEDCLYDYVSVQDSAEVAPGSGAPPEDAAAAEADIYSSADLAAKRWYRNDLQRIGRLKRSLRHTRYGGLESLLLGHEIGFLRRLRDSMLQSATAGVPQRRSRRSPLDPLASAAGQPTFAPYVRWCGMHSANMTRFDFVAATNVAIVHFHSDYSVAAMGFSAQWSAIDVTGCPAQTLTAAEGRLQSPNYPHFLLNAVQCEFEIYAGRGRRVWLEFEDFEVLQDGLVEVDVGDGAGVVVPFRTASAGGAVLGGGGEGWRQAAAAGGGGDAEREREQRHLNDGLYVSTANRMVVRLRTGAYPRGRGFRAVYRTVTSIAETHRIALPDTAYGHLYHLNHPLPLPAGINYTQHLVAPVGYVVFLELFGVRFSDRPCEAPSPSLLAAAANGSSPTFAGSLEVFDRYADENGTGWTLCDAGASGAAATPVHITSFLNTLHVRQLSGASGSGGGARLNASIRVIADLQYKRKLALGGDQVETCQPNPCLFGGRCVSSPVSGSRCVCSGHFTGRFCALTACEVAPCMYGKCQLTAAGFKCVCQKGYVGRTCERRQPPCALNPCEGRGECINRADDFVCRCHAWWEGVRCEKRMQNIPYKPLSDRMLQEPFWLGLITVFVVLAFIGLVWCAKRHFPEKIEKLLTEEAERNRPPGMAGPHHHHHHQSLREQLQFTTTATTSSSATHSNVTTPGAARTIFSRFGIRKPSIVSVSSTPQPLIGGTGHGTSPHGCGSDENGGGGPSGGPPAAARTFSLDDLLRPPPRRTPSPRKKRNNSTPTKPPSTSAAEKKHILQQLIGPAAAGGAEKIALNDLISIEVAGGSGGGGSSSGGGRRSSAGYRETTLCEGPELAELANDAKLEKKVTFARLLNKVSAEMSSSSETGHSGGGGRVSSAGGGGGLGLPEGSHHRRTSSMPPSPCDLDVGGRQSAAAAKSCSTSSHSSDSMSSSELMLMPTTVGVDQHQQPQQQQLPNQPHHQRYGSGGSAASLSVGQPLAKSMRTKVSSADSLLTMFRNLTSSRSGAQSGHASSERSALSPSSSLATSSASPHDDQAAGDDDSSTSSSLHTPVSFNSLSNGGGSCGITFEVSAVDLLKMAGDEELAAAGGGQHSPTTEAAGGGSGQLSISSVSGGTYLMPNSGLSLDLPANINQCLSPIRELPTPMPSPAPTPVMMRQHSFAARFGGRSGAQDVPDEPDEQLQIERNATGITFKSFITKQPSIEATTYEMANGPQLTVPSIQISADAEADADEASAAGGSGGKQRVPAVRPTQLIIPTLVVEQSSPVAERLPVMFLGSPPPQRQSVGETNFYTGNGTRKNLKSMDKPSSLDLLCMPPTITITPNQHRQHQHQHQSGGSHHTDTTTTISDSSDADLNHHGGHGCGGGGAGGGSGAGSQGGGRQLHLLKVPTMGMTYLSPFSMCSRDRDRTISEGNLSSSGYSSMASPGQSRCGSSNPLLPDGTPGGDSGSGGSGAGGGGGGLGTSIAGSSTAPAAGAIVSIGAMGATSNTSGTTTSTHLRDASGGGGSLAAAAATSPSPAGRMGGGGGGIGAAHLMMHLGGPGGKLQQLAARRARLRSDSETLSDDLVLESNDEGIEMDHGGGSGGAEETPENVDVDVAGRLGGAVSLAGTSSADVVSGGPMQLAAIVPVAKKTDPVISMSTVNTTKPGQQPALINPTDARGNEEGRPAPSDLSALPSIVTTATDVEADKAAATGNWVMRQLQLPTITLHTCEPIEVDETGKSAALSTGTSRSESPLSERLPDTKRSFSALFYDSKDQQLPFTDSDGLYDFPSPDGRRSAEPQPSAHRRSNSSSSSSKRRAARKSSRSPSANTIASPAQCSTSTLQAAGVKLTADQHHHLDVKSASGSLQTVGQRRSPTKRRSMAATHRQHRMAAEQSSSSSESIVPRRPADRSTSDLLANQLLAAVNPNSPLLLLGSHSADEQLSNTAGSDQQLYRAGADTAELVERPSKPLVRSNRRLNRFRAIGNQLKFLRRFERPKSTAATVVSQPETAPQLTSAAKCSHPTSSQQQPQQPPSQSTSYNPFRHSFDRPNDRKDAAAAATAMAGDSSNLEDDDDDDDEDVAFVTSPLLAPSSGQQPSTSAASEPTAPAHHRRRAWSALDADAATPLLRFAGCPPASMAEKASDAGEPEAGGGSGAAGDEAAFVPAAKRPTSIYGGTRRPWRSRNRRFIYDGGNINSD